MLHATIDRAEGLLAGWNPSMQQQLGGIGGVQQGAIASGVQQGISGASPSGARPSTVLLRLIQASSPPRRASNMEGEGNAFTAPVL